jgi:hypothetical protein
MNTISRAGPLLGLPASLRPLITARLYATQTGLGTAGTSSKPRRKAVTAFNDDGSAVGRFECWRKGRKDDAANFQSRLHYTRCCPDGKGSNSSGEQSSANINPREEWPMLCIQKSFLRTAKRAISTEL